MTDSIPDIGFVKHFLSLPDFPNLPPRHQLPPPKPPQPHHHTAQPAHRAPLPLPHLTHPNPAHLRSRRTPASLNTPLPVPAGLKEAQCDRLLGGALRYPRSTIKDNPNPNSLTPPAAPAHLKSQFSTARRRLWTAVSVTAPNTPPPNQHWDREALYSPSPHHAPFLRANGATPYQPGAIAPGPPQQHHPASCRDATYHLPPPNHAPR